ncbi:hypothetical protein ACIKTA_09300 [Hansschlegelia beijingensis]|uniref:hypothetical protein n=1 Tax=Hansschlegelia beijingensis TaxID=1133344 RepID=UPI0037F6B297
MRRFVTGCSFAAGLALSVVMAAPAYAAPTAVDLVFYAPFLKKVENGSELSYRYVRKADGKDLAPSFEDEVKLTVGPKGAEDSIKIDLFTGARGRALENLARSGNPLVIAVLEENVREMQKISGGSPYYLRNRIMEALKANPPIEQTKIQYDGRTIDAWTVKLEPFAKDQHRMQLKGFADRTYELTFADDVPGGLYALKSVTPKPDRTGPLLVEELTLQSSKATQTTEGAKQ